MKSDSYFSFTISFKNEPLLLLPPRECLTIYHLCPNNTHTSITDSSPWMEVTNYICYILLPITLFFSILGQVINIVIFVRQIRISLDTYLLVLSIMSLLQSVVTIILCFPNYIGHNDFIVHIQYYCYICREWFWYTCIWILVSAILERSVTLIILHAHNSGTSNQTCLITGIVTCIGFLSALPWLWKYKVFTYTTQMEYSSTNQTVSVIINKSQHTGYHDVYFWYIFSVFVILPSVLMLISCIPLCQSTNKSECRDNFNSKCNTNNAMILNRRLKEDKALTKLLVAMVILYLTLTTPSVLTHFLSKLLPDVIDLNDIFTITLLNIFTILYYMYYVLHQQLYFCYNKQYRLTLLSLCCCCC